MDQQKDNKTKWIKWGIIAFIALVGLIKCDSIIDSTKALIKPSNSSIDTVEIHTIDTIKPEPIKVPFKVYVPKPYVVHDTVVRINGKDTCTNVKIYEDSLTDNKVSIYYKDYVSQGELLGKDISYILKVPLTIIDSKTLTITKTDTLYKQPKYSISVGAAVGTQLLCPTANVTIDRHTFGFGYNLQTKTPTIQYNFRLWSSKKR